MTGLDPQLLDLFKAVLGFLGVFLAAWLTNKVARRNVKAVEKTTQLETQLKPMQATVDAWEKLNKPLLDEVARLGQKASTDSGRIKSLEDALHAVENETRALTEDYGRALALLISFVQWIDSGAQPPPPDVPSWLRDHMAAAFRRVHSTKHDEGA